MARALETIQTQIITQLAAAGIVVNINDSVTSRRRNWVHVIAFCIWFLESLFDIFKNDVDAKLRELKPHTDRWYRNKALDYQHGHNLITDSDIFDTTGYTAEQVANSKVVKYAAVVPQENMFGRVYLRIKVATITAGDLAPLTAPELDGVKEYFKRVKDAGVKLQIDSLPADSIKMNWRVFYDPLILDANGNRTDGSASNVVRTAIKNYLTRLPFNGLYVKQFHIDDLQLLDGVVICEVDLCQAKYGLLPFTNIDIKHLPDSGYLRFASDADLLITYIPQSAIQ